jgi:hypothetical protein
LKLTPSHRCGCIIGNDALFAAFPKFPAQAPWLTANEMDETTGISLLLTYGSNLEKATTGFIHRVMWGSFLHPDCSQRLLFPV